VRVDHLIFLLRGTVNTDFRVTYYKIKRGLQPMELSEYAKKRRAKAIALTFDEVQNMVIAIIDERKVFTNMEATHEHNAINFHSDHLLFTQFLVKSFTRPNTEYTPSLRM